MGDRVSKAGKEAEKKAEKTGDELKDKTKKGVESAKDFLGGLGK